MDLLRYKYYDTPEGTNLAGKLVYTNKYAIGLGLIWSTYDVSLHTRPVGIVPTVGRYFYHAGYLSAMATTFTTSVYILNQVTGKDSKLNYAISGALAGSIMGAYAKGARHGWNGALVGAIMGFSKKLSIEEGWQFFFHEKPRQMAGGADIIYHDFTLQKDDLPKGWTTNPNEA